MRISSTGEMSEKSCSSRIEPPRLGLTLAAQAPSTTRSLRRASSDRYPKCSVSKPFEPRSWPSHLARWMACTRRACVRNGQRRAYSSSRGRDNRVCTHFQALRVRRVQASTADAPRVPRASLSRSGTTSAPAKPTTALRVRLSPKAHKCRRPMQTMLRRQRARLRTMTSCSYPRAFVLWRSRPEQPPRCSLGK